MATNNMHTVDNTIVTNKATTILAIEMLKKSGFVRIGAREYFADQINGSMRTGKEYDFIKADAGNVVEGLVISPRPIDERKVSLKITNFNNSVQADALELVTDIKWKEEVAKTYAGKLVNAVIRKAVKEALPKATTCFVGEGFKPLDESIAHVKSIVNEDIVGFIHPQATAVIRTNGQQFQPVGTPGLYNGEIGTFDTVKFNEERFLPAVKIEQGVIDALSGAKAKNITTADKLSISGVTTAADTVLKAGTPIWVDGAYACDTVGDETSIPYAFIVKEDVALSSTTVDVSIDEVVTDDVGARSLNTSALGGKKVSIPASGTYYPAMIRAEGAYCYTPVNTLQFDLSEKRAVADTAGLKVFCNSFSDGVSAINTIRWDAPAMFGTVENRAVSLAYLKK